MTPEVCGLPDSDGADVVGIWRVKRLAAGTSTFAIEPGLVERDTFDVARLTGEGLRWCVKAERGEYNPAWAKKS